MMWVCQILQTLFIYAIQDTGYLISGRILIVNYTMCNKMLIAYFGLNIKEKQLKHKM